MSMKKYIAMAAAMGLMADSMTYNDLNIKPKSRNQKTELTPKQA